MFVNYRALLRLTFVALLTSLAILIATPAQADQDSNEVWSAPAFSVPAPVLLKAASAIEPAKQRSATVLLNDVHHEFDAQGRRTSKFHLIYRIENQDGVSGWAETSGQWESWYQARPKIRARVVGLDAAEHWLDPKTLIDAPVKSDDNQIYSDDRTYGGPLPALSPGVVVEEEVVIEGTAPYFSGGSFVSTNLGWNTEVNQSRVTLVHPVSLPVRFEALMLPDLKTSRSTKAGTETIVFEQAKLPAYDQKPTDIPRNAVVRPEIQISTGASWHDVAQSYSRIVDAKISTADLSPLTAALDLKTGTRTDVIRRIVSALHKNVRYTGLEFGEGGLIPQDPGETLKRKYGDCKDKATLLVALLRKSNIAASLALLVAGSPSDINPNLPGMGMFDHAIVYVPPAGGDPELWIDATSQYTQVGVLPWDDYERYALVAADASVSLLRTPKLTAPQNVHREIREIRLAEFGNADIAETNTQLGPEEADYRGYYISDTKEVRESALTYVKSAYLAKSLGALEHSDLANLEVPASVTFRAKGGRGFTDISSAVAAISTYSLYTALPSYFTTEEEAPTSGATDSSAGEQRKIDWRLTPFIKEWHYKIVAPPGFKVKGVPEDKQQKIDALQYSQSFSVNGEGTVVEALVRLESPLAQLNVDQARSLREAVLQAQDAPTLLINFDHVGSALIASGKIKEGLASFAAITSIHPKEAIHKIQLAQAFLTAGLGEPAREVARSAVQLEPNSSLAHKQLGLILEHDLVGRLQKLGMDYDGAVAEFRRAIALDPTDSEARANLALLLEVDANGLRYSPKARLREAILALRELKKADPDFSETYDDNVAYDLWYLGDYPAVLAEVASLSPSDNRKGLILGALAALKGPDAAINKSLELSESEGQRSNLLAGAAQLLFRVRKHTEASALFLAAVRGAKDGARLATIGTLLSNAKPFESQLPNVDTPTSFVTRFLIRVLSEQTTATEVKALLASEMFEAGIDVTESDLATIKKQVRAMGTQDIPFASIADLVVAGLKANAEGDDRLGYKVVASLNGRDVLTLYVVRQADGYKLIAHSSGDSLDFGPVATLVLKQIDQGNLDVAETWLNRARDFVRITDGDDPLSGSQFPYFWSKGQSGDKSAMRLAALTLLHSKALKGPLLDEVQRARDGQADGMLRNRLNLVLADAYSSQEAWDALLPVALNLARSLPSSARAMGLAQYSATRLNRFDEIQQILADRQANKPDDSLTIRFAASLAEVRQQPAAARAMLKPLIDSGRATNNELNQFAWLALEAAPPISKDAVDAAIRANEGSNRSIYNFLHTLGCVQAAYGATGDARDALLKALAVSGSESPDGNLWLGFGLIAEQYGLKDAAISYYRRIERPKIPMVGSSFSIAQSRLNVLASP